MVGGLSGTARLLEFSARDLGSGLATGCRARCVDGTRLSGISDALGRIVSGCFVLTLPADGAGPATGLLVSFAQQVGFAPPRLVVAIKRGRPVLERLIPGAACVLNICAEGDATLLSRFARHPDPGVDAFGGLAHQERAEGVILDAAAGYLACAIVARFDAGDHWLLLAEARDGCAFADRRPYVHVRRNGLNY